MQFTQKTYSKSPENINIDWGDKADIKEIFSTAYERIQKIILMEGNISVFEHNIKKLSF